MTRKHLKSQGIHICISVSWKFECLRLLGWREMKKHSQQTPALQAILNGAQLWQPGVLGNGPSQIITVLHPNFLELIPISELSCFVVSSFLFILFFPSFSPFILSVWRHSVYRPGWPWTQLFSLSPPTSRWDLQGWSTPDPVLEFSLARVFLLNVGLPLILNAYITNITLSPVEYII